MNNDGIEDILINKDYNTKKKKGKGFFVLFFLLLILLALFVGAYLYLTKETVSSKELFAQNMSKLNVNKLFDNGFYIELIEKMQKENSQTTSSVKLTTDLENEELKDIDVTKFKLDIANSNDVETQKNFSEAVLNYSGNEIFKVGLISAENEIALASNEIMNQYVGIHQDKIKDVFGIDIDFDKIKELKDAEGFKFSNEEIDTNTQKYFKLALDNIPEEKFSVQENIAIENATENVEVTNYSVTLTQDELESILITVLENLKNDKDLRKKLITNYKKIEKTTENVDTNANPEENLKTNIPIVQINPVGTAIPIVNQNEEQSETIQIEGNATNTVIEENSEGVENLTNEVERATINTTEKTNENEDIKVVESTNIEELINQDKNIENQIINLLLGKKINLTNDEYEKLINELIERVKKLTGNGIKINVYSSKEDIKKINIVLPDESIVDLDFIQVGNSNQSHIKLTYLAENNETSEKNGFTLEISKEYKNASTTTSAEYSFIENEKINRKIKFNLKTEGTINSKELKNDIVVTISSNKGETQVAIDNEIKFIDVSDLPGLNSENCIYLDLLPEEDRKNLIDTIKTQLMTLYTNKKENLNFIDTNTYSQTTLENQTTETTPKVTREDAKNALINKVSIMMQDAIDKGEEFTIQNLKDLEIKGYKVSSAVTTDAALIVVDVYTFNIDTSFTLTDVE